MHYVLLGLRQHLEPEVPRAAPALGRQEHHLLLPLPGQVCLQGLSEGAPAQGPPGQVPVRGTGARTDWDQETEPGSRKLARSERKTNIDRHNAIK